jgi:hypothetical protein
VGDEYLLLMGGLGLFTMAIAVAVFALAWRIVK